MNFQSTFKTIDQIRLLFSGNFANYTIIVICIIVGVFALSRLKSALARYIGSLKHNSRFSIFDVLLETLSLMSWPLYLIISTNFALIFLPNLNLKAQEWLTFILFLTTTVYISLILSKITTLVIQFVIKNRTAHGEDPNFDPSGLRFLEFGVNIIIWVVMILFILQNRNININALVGGLGVAGVGIAFAFQNILGDLFASISIYSDKPFVVGDTIKVGDEIGEVTKIGLKTTRIRTIGGGELVVSNKELSGTRIKNLTHVAKRRVSMEIKIVKSSRKNDSKDLRELSASLKTLVDSHQKAKFKDCLLKSVSDKYYILDLTYEVNKVSYADYLSTQNTICFDILELLGKDKAEFSVID